MNCRLPGPIIKRLNTVANEVLNDPQAKEMLEAKGITVEGGTPEFLGDCIRTVTKRQAEIVEAINATAG